MTVIAPWIEHDALIDWEAMRNDSDCEPEQFFVNLLRLIGNDHDSARKQGGKKKFVFLREIAGKTAFYLIWIDWIDGFNIQRIFISLNLEEGTEIPNTKFQISNNFQSPNFPVRTDGHPDRQNHFTFIEKSFPWICFSGTGIEILLSFREYPRACIEKSYSCI